MSSIKRPPSSSSTLPEKDELSKRHKKSQSTLDQFASNQTYEQHKMDQNEQFQMLMNRTEKLLGEWENFQANIVSQFKEINEKQSAMCNECNK